MDSSSKKTILIKLFEGTSEGRYNWELNQSSSSFRLSFGKSTLILSEVTARDEWDEPYQSYSLKILSSEGHVVETLYPADFHDVVPEPDKYFRKICEAIKDQIFKISETIDDILKNL